MQTLPAQGAMTCFQTALVAESGLAMAAQCLAGLGWESDGPEESQSQMMGQGSLIVQLLLFLTVIRMPWI